MFVHKIVTKVGEKKIFIFIFHLMLKLGCGIAIVRTREKLNFFRVTNPGIGQAIFFKIKMAIFYFALHGQIETGHNCGV